jgi:hypothetical protein
VAHFPFSFTSVAPSHFFCPSPCLPFRCSIFTSYSLLCFPFLFTSTFIPSLRSSSFHLSHILYFFFLSHFLPIFIPRPKFAVKRYILTSYWGDPRFKSQPRIGFLQVYSGFVKLVRKIAEVLPQIRPRSIPSTSFLIHYSLIILSLYTLYYSLFLWLYSPLDPGRFFSSLILYTVGRTLWTGDQPVVRPHTEQHKQNKRTQTCMPWVGFEPTTPVFERAKTVHALYRAATVTGYSLQLGTISTLCDFSN